MRHYVVKGRVISRKDDRDDDIDKQKNERIVLGPVAINLIIWFLLLLISFGAFTSVLLYADKVDISYTPLGEELAKEFNYEGDPKGIGAYLYDYVDNSYDTTDVKVVKAKKLIGKPVFEQKTRVTDVEFFDKQDDLLINISKYKRLTGIADVIITFTNLIALVLGVLLSIQIPLYLSGRENK